MKLTFFILLVSFLNVSAHSFSQSISFSGEGLVLGKLFKEIERQTHFVVAYKVEALEKSKPIKVNAHHTPLVVLLNQVFENQPLQFSIKENTIFITEKPQTLMVVAPSRSRIPALKESVVINNIDIKGTVYNQNGEPLAGVNIVIKGSTRGTTTDEKGVFVLSNVPLGAVLEFSSAGHKSKEHKVTSRSENIKMTLEENVSEMDVAVATGYKTIKRGSVTGAISTVKVDDIKVASMGTLDKMLQGQVAGVAIENTSSVFGTAPKIRVRGSSSLSGINEPLWVLDGIPLEAPLNIAPSELYSGNARNLLASALAGVNPEDIEDLTVLKDAAATAMYGTRAVNGVIVITTKRARKNTPLTIGYTTTNTLTLKPSIENFDVLNSNEETELHKQVSRIYESSINNFAARNTGALSKLVNQRNRKDITEEQYLAGLKQMRENNTDWFDYLYKNALMTQHSLSASYGGEKGSNRFSISYLGDQGKTIGEKVQRYTANLVSDYSLSSRLSAEILLKYSYRKQKNPGTQVNPYSYARNASRAMRPYNDQGEYEYYKKGYADFNILDEINNNYINLTSSDFSVQAGLTYKFTKKIKWNTLFNTRSVISLGDEIQSEHSNYANQYRQTSAVKEDGFNLKDPFTGVNPRLYRDPDKSLISLPVVILPAGGILDQTSVKSNFSTFRTQINFDELEVGNADHKVSGLLGSEIVANKQNTYFNRNYGWRDDIGVGVPSALATKRLIENNSLVSDERVMYNGRNLLAGTNYYRLLYQRNTASFYGGLTYNYRNRYILDGSARLDGSNVTKSKLTPTWNIGVAWNLTQEDFMESLRSSISNFKLRGSYGLRGNDGARGPGFVSYYTNYSRVYTKYSGTAIVVNEPENRSLEFEKEYTLSVGADLTLFSRADITINWYNRKNFNLLGEKDVPMSTGYVTKVYNWADMRNRGYEFSLNIRPVDLSQDFSISCMFNVAYNKNTLLADYSGNNPSVFEMARPQGFPKIGKPLTGLYSFKFAGLSNDGLPQYYDKDGQKVPGFISADRNFANLEYQGSRDPLYSGGFTPSFIYKNFSLSAAFVFNAGHVVRKADFYRDGSMSSLFRDDLNVPGDFVDRWKVPGQEAYTVYPRLIDRYDTNDFSIAGFSSESIFKAYNYNSAQTVDASFIRFRNLSFQWKLPRLAKRIGIQGLQVGAEASNIAIWASKRLNGQDPETLLNGINVPPVKSFTFSLNTLF